MRLWGDQGKRGLQVLTSDEVMKELSFRKQLLDRGLLLVLRGSTEKKGKYRVKLFSDVCYCGL